MSMLCATKSLRAQIANDAIASNPTLMVGCPEWWKAYTLAFAPVSKANSADPFDPNSDAYRWSADDVLVPAV